MAIRVYELARDLGLDQADAFARLQRLGVHVNNHMSTVTDEQASSLRGMVRIERVREDLVAARAVVAGVGGTSQQAEVRAGPIVVARMYAGRRTEPTFTQGPSLRSSPISPQWSRLSSSRYSTSHGVSTS